MNIAIVGTGYDLHLKAMSYLEYLFHMDISAWN